jgi:prevent-host-death family protein
MRTYTTYEAKAKLSEILRRVRGGETVRISYYGEEVAEVRPIEAHLDTRRRLERLVAAGIVEAPGDAGSRLEAIAQRQGALRRFLEERE